MLRVDLFTLNRMAGMAVIKRASDTLMARKIWAVDNTDYRHPPEAMQAKGVQVAFYLIGDTIPGAADILPGYFGEGPLNIVRTAVTEAIKSLGVHSHVNG